MPPLWAGCRNRRSRRTRRPKYAPPRWPICLPARQRLINTCYSLVAPDYGITVVGVYKPANGVLADIEGAGGVSPIDAARENRALEAQFAEGWFKTITGEVFG